MTPPTFTPQVESEVSRLVTLPLLLLLLLPLQAWLYCPGGSCHFAPVQSCASPWVLQEIQMMEQLSFDRNIVQFYGACLAPPHPMLILEYMEGEQPCPVHCWVAF